MDSGSKATVIGLSINDFLSQQVAASLLLYLESVSTIQLASKKYVPDLQCEEQLHQLEHIVLLSLSP